MRKAMLWGLLTALMLVVMMVSGCGNSGSTARDTTNTGHGTSQGGQWPSQMPPDVPKFSYGTITSSNVVGPNIMVFYSNVTPDFYDKYQSDLKNAGWTITSVAMYKANNILIATKGRRQVDVEFSKHNGELGGKLQYSANGVQ